MSLLEAVLFLSHRNSLYFPYLLLKTKKNLEGKEKNMIIFRTVSEN